MNPTVVRIGIAVLAAAVVTPLYATQGSATPGSGVSQTPLALGRLEEVDAKVRTGAWKVQLRTKELSDVVVLENRLAPGGTFGWHSHPGPSIVVVKSGTVTFYRGDDEACAGTPYSAGASYVDPGGTVHMARNETDAPVVLIVTSLIPAGATRRIDADPPAHCPS